MDEAAAVAETHRAYPVPGNPGESVKPVGLPSWTSPVFLLFGIGLVPWTIWLASSLPHRQVTDNYHLMWVGFDVALTVVLLSVMWLSWRGSTYVGPVSAAAGAMLLADAWFDITSARPGRDVAVAVVSAVFVELPVTVLCWSVARNTEKVRRRREAMLLERLAATGAEEPRRRIQLPDGSPREDAPTALGTRRDRAIVAHPDAAPRRRTPTPRSGRTAA